MKHTALIGIEHLMTGLQLLGEQPDQVFTFQRESASVVRVISDSPFNLYWTAKGTFLRSTTEESVTELHCGPRHTEFYAETMGRMMQKADALHDTDGDVLPDAIAWALKGKFGRLATTIPVHKGYPTYWFTYAGMFHGIEPDGYIHT